MAQALALESRRLRNAGLRLDDRLITEPSFDRRLDDFIGYCQGRHILKSSTPGSYVINRERVLDSGSLGHRENPVKYSNNEIESLMEIMQCPDAD